MPLETGIVACSDKRATIKRGTVVTGESTEGFKKTFIIGPRTIAQVYGEVAISDGKNEKVLFSALDIVPKFASKHPFSNTKQYWDH